MTITICGSIKFYDEMLLVEKRLKELGHRIYMPVKAKGVDYWEADNSTRVVAKKKFDLISKHYDKIDNSNAILVLNYSKKDINYYIGANNFLEMGFAHYRKKKIYALNPLPDQPYIIDELLTFDPIILNGQLELIK